MHRDRCLSVCNVGVLRPNGWMDQDATWYGGRPRPRRHCVRWRPSNTPVERGTKAPPHTFRTMSIVVKRSPISATAELLFEISQLLTKLCSTFKHDHHLTFTERDSVMRQRLSVVVYGLKIKKTRNVQRDGRPAE